MTKDKIDTLLEHSERLGLGVNNEDGVDGRESTRSDDALLVSVVSVPLYSLFNPPLNLF